MADITYLEIEGFLKRKRENTASPSISPLNKKKPEICSVDRNNNYNKWTPEEKENLLATVTECTFNDSTEWKSVTESLNVMFGSNRTAKSCQNQYKRIMAFKDSENKVEMVNASCQTDITLNPNDNFVFMKMDEEILELRTNSSDSHDSVDTAYESESSSSVLRTMLLDDSFLPCLTSTPKKHEKIVDEKGEGKVMPKENKARVGSDHSYISSLQIKPAKRHIGAPGKRVEKFNKIIPHLTDTTKSKVITTKDIVMLRHTMSTTRNTKNMSRIIMSIEPLREAILDNISNSVGDRPNEMRNKKKGYTSYLMEKGPESLEELNFEKVIEEMKQKFPEVLQILICIMLPKEKRSSEIALANILPRLAMIYGMMMQSRYHELSRIQRVIAMCLADNICDQSVYDRLNRLGVSSSYCVAVDTITKLGKRYTGFLVKFLEEGKFIRLIGDNLNFTVGTSHETKSQHKHMVHMFTSLALISDHHFLTKPVEPEILLNHLSIDNILLSKKEYKMIRHEVIGLIIDTAVKFLPNISFLKESKSLEYISAKTEVIPLPCLPYNENKYQDDVKILAWYQQLLDTIKKEAGADADLKFVIGGDQLTRERLSEAMLLRFGNIDPQDQFSHIGRCVAEFFHLGMNYLEKVVFGELWNVEGVVEKGTLRGECERLSRKTVDPKVMKAYEADKDFVDNYLSANIIEALMSYFGMDNQNDFPTQNLPPTSFDDDRAREIWTYNTLEQFVDTFVFPSWSGHVQDDQVLEDPTEINEYIELLLDNGQTIHIPVAVSEYTFQKLKPDKVKDYAHYSLEVGLIFRYFLNLCKEPVREQFLPLLKMMMVQLRGHSICAKYPKEILRMLVQQYSVMGLQEACQVFCASFVNLHGRKDGNVPADLVQEWNVKESKKHIKHMFSNKENSTIEHKTSALPSIHKIASNFDTEVGTLVRAKRHKDKSYDDEVCVIMEDLREILPFTHQEGRSYETFKNIPKSLCEKVDGLKLQKWFKKHKNSFPL